MYPTFIYKEGMELPTEGTFFVVAGNGQFLHKDTGQFKGFVQVQNISCLDDFPQYSPASTSLPAIPHHWVMQVRKFFADVFTKHHSEACVLIYFNPTDQTYWIDAPDQQTSHIAVMYKPGPVPSNYRLVGSIHSHCDFNAFHSGVDDADEKHFDGLHVTFGHVNSPNGISCSASIVLNGERTMIDPSSILEGLKLSGERYLIIPPSYEVDFDQLHRNVQTWMENVNNRKLSS